MMLGNILTNRQLHHVGVLCNMSYYVNNVRCIQDLENWVYLAEYECYCYMMVDRVEYVVPTGGRLLDRLLEVGSPSLHHYAYQVPNIEQACAKLRQLGIRLTNQDIVTGVGGIRVNFIHPTTYGILIELVEDNNNER